MVKYLSIFDKILFLFIQAQWVKFI